MTEQERDEFAEIIEQAATMAAQRVAAIHRKRLVRQTFLAALVVALSVAIVVSVLVAHNQRQFYKHDLAYNCSLFQQVADLDADFISTDATNRAGALSASQKRQVIQKFSEITALKDLAAISKLQDKLDRDTIHHWRVYNVRRLRDLAKQNCLR